MIYVQAVNTGKGFITHTDNAVMRFVGREDGIYEVHNDDALAETWRARVSGVKLSANVALNKILDVTNLSYTHEEFVMSAFNADEIMAILAAAGGDAEVRQLISDFVLLSSIKMSDNTISLMLETLVLKGIITPQRKTSILAGK